MASNKRIIFQLFLLCVGGVLSFSSCSLLETERVIVPAYIYVPSLHYNTTNSLQDEGDSSFKFVDVWIYDNGSLLGNIGLPAMIPVQKNGVSEMEFDPGILKTGQDDTRIPYPFIARQRFSNIQLSPNKTDTFYPDFKYLPETKFGLIEGFEKPGFRFSYGLTNTPGDTIIRVKDSTNMVSGIRLGNLSGKVIMSPSSGFFEIHSTDIFAKADLQPYAGGPVYLEIDYKSDLPLQIGMLSYDLNGIPSPVPEIVTNPTNFWNKVYICLDQDITPTQPGTSFSISIQIFNTTGVQPNIFIDNIKLVHF